MIDLEAYDPDYNPIKDKAQDICAAMGFGPSIGTPLHVLVYAAAAICYEIQELKRTISRNK